MRLPVSYQRVAVSVLCGVFGAGLIYFQYAAPQFHTDFGMSWFGAKSLLHGVDPYPLVGKGKLFDYRWPLTYPATSIAALLPFGLLSERVAATIFVGLSSSVLAFGMARAGKWHLFPLFLSESFMNAARLGQWNILLVAILFFPALSLFASVKPQTAVPLLIGSETSSVLMWCALGSLFLLFVSIALIPQWIPEWLQIVRHMEDMSPPVMRFGGFLLLLAGIRWKRPESRLLLAMACIPQSLAWYSALPLFTIPKNWKESIALFLIAMIGAYAGVMLMPEGLDKAGFNSYFGGLFVVTMYLPCLVMVLMRPNE